MNITDRFFPFEWESWTDIDGFIFQFINVTFTKDFGPYTIGDKAAIVCFDLESGIFTEYDKHNEVLETFSIKIQPERE